MKKFKFRLQKILAVRLLKEKEQKLVVARVNDRLRAETDLLFRLEEEYTTLKIELKSKHNRRMSVNDLLAYNSYFAYLEAKIEIKKEIILELETRLKVEREKLQLLVKDRKVLDKLREKKYKQYWDSYLREEQSSLDEIAIGLVVRGTGN